MITACNFVTSGDLKTVSFLLYMLFSLKLINAASLVCNQKKQRLELLENNGKVPVNFNKSQMYSKIWKTTNFWKYLFPNVNHPTL